jgi:hypothetical protein
MGATTEGTVAGVVGDVTVQAVVGELVRLAGELASAGDALAGVASGVDRTIPPVPEDEHGLGLAFVALDEAREQLERQTSATVHDLARDLYAVAARGRESDAAGAAAFAAMDGGS